MSLARGYIQNADLASLLQLLGHVNQVFIHYHKALLKNFTSEVALFENMQCLRCSVWEGAK
jgi:hypothetical protein